MSLLGSKSGFAGFISWNHNNPILQMVKTKLRKKNKVQSDTASGWWRCDFNSVGFQNLISWAALMNANWDELGTRKTSSTEPEPKPRDPLQTDAWNFAIFQFFFKKLLRPVPRPRGA